MANTYDFGLVGLGVMGRNFILNVADHGFSAFGLDMDPMKVQSLREEGAGKPVDGTTDKREFVAKLSAPRKIMLLVPAGAPVDAVISELLPLLDKGDLIIDGGNSYFTDTDRRADFLAGKGIFFFGTGVSGGAKGARFGPSIMPGGDKNAYEIVRPVFEAVSAKVNGEPCVDYMGARSAGNYVKMVHNGIEYGLMQLISEVYDVLKRGLDKNNEELHQIFSSWNSSKLQSFLVEITADIFTRKDDLSREYLVDVILDKAKQKGTGKWTSQNAFDLGIPIPTIDVSVRMREISTFKAEREQAEGLYGKRAIAEGNAPSVADLENALYFACIVTYAQGMTQLATASKEYRYGCDLETIARIWRGGCIIRSGLLEDMRKAYSRNKDLISLLLDADIAAALKKCEASMRKVVVFAAASGIPASALSSCLHYFDAFTTARLPLNLIQAQRDHFGSHTYERLDREGVFHTEW